MRLLFVNMFYPPQNAATAHYLGEMCQRLAARGHVVSVVCSRQGYLGGVEEVPRRETRGGVKIERLWGAGLGKSGWLRRICDYSVFGLLAAVAVLRRSRVEWVICLTSPPFIDAIGVLHRAIYRSRLAVWSMDCYPEMLVRTGVIRRASWRGKLLARARVYCATRTDLCLALDSDMAEQLRSEGYRRIACVHNWGDDSRGDDAGPGVAEVRAELAGGARMLTLYAGNLGRPHEYGTFLGMAEALRGCDGLRFVFRGGGESWPHLTEQVQARGLRAVTVGGYLPKRQMPKALASADLLLMCLNPSIVGVASPSKLYGYLQAGRPILYVGPRDSEAGRAIVASGCGWVVASGDSQTAARCVERLLVDPELGAIMGKAGRTYYEAHYGLGKSSDVFEGQLEAMLQADEP